MYVVEGESGDYYRCLLIKEGAALQSFDGAYHFCGTKSAVRRMVANAVPPRLAEAVARSIGEDQTRVTQPAALTTAAPFS